MIWKIRDLIRHVRWLLAGRPPVHIDASLTAISVPYHEDDHAP
jgi:hypothetical protein